MIVEKIYELARRQPAHPAIVHNGTSIGYAAFARAIAIAREALIAAGLPRGKTAGMVAAGNLFETWAIDTALRSLGADTLAAPTLKELLELDPPGLGCVVTTAREEGDGRLVGRERAPCAVAVLTPIGLARIFAGDLPTLPPSHAPYGGHYVYSSGTTGRFKKIYYDAAREEPRAAARRAALSLPPGNVHHAMRTALWTGNGWKAPLAHWWHGGTVIFEQREGGAFDFMAEQEFGSITLAPPMLKQLLARADAAVIRNPDCRVFSGFGLVSKTLIQDLRTRLRRRFVRNYSCSELAVPSLLSAIDGAEDLDWYAPTPGKRVQIVDESGAPLPPGTQGEVRIALTELDASGYADDRQASARAFRDGFFHPGDLGVMRADGRVSILGRAADVLVVQGRKVPVAPFEQDLQRMFDGAEVCVFSHLNAKGDEELVIAIESATRPSAPKLQDAVRMFTEFGQVRFVMRSQFPRTDDTARKVRRAALKALLAS